MSGVLQGALGGGRALLIGWFLPSLINLLILGSVVFPGFSGFHALGASGHSPALRPAVFTLTGTTVLGLALAALQTPLYRILEGYLAWPERLFRAGHRRQVADKHLLQNRLDAAELARREKGGALTDAERHLLDRFRAHPVTGRFTDSDARKGPVWRSVLDERLHRYPISDAQVTPTRLGNAIRRFEEYGFDRFRLDSQVLWHELNAVVPDAARKQVEDARANVDFFVCLLVGHLLVAVAACAELAAGSPARPWLETAVIAGLLILAVAWYRVAVAATDDWAGAVRAMVNLGRPPLAAALGLELPGLMADERTMWALVTELARERYRPELAVGLDTFRGRGRGPDRVG